LRVGDWAARGRGSEWLKVRKEDKESVRPGVRPEYGRKPGLPLREAVGRAEWRRGGEMVDGGLAGELWAVTERLTAGG
jgi:hypothetical protein